MQWQSEEIKASNFGRFERSSAASDRMYQRCYGLSYAMGFPLDLTYAYTDILSSNCNPVGSAFKAEMLHINEDLILQDNLWLPELYRYLQSVGPVYKYEEYSGSSANVGYHVLLPKAYEKFIYLWSIKTNENVKHKSFKPILPTIPIDLAWHTHQIHPIAYRKFTEEMLGFVLEHEPLTKDNKAESLLCYTDTIWKAEFDQSIHEEHLLC